MTLVISLCVKLLVERVKAPSKSVFGLPDILCPLRVPQNEVVALFFFLENSKLHLLARNC